MIKHIFYIKDKVVTVLVDIAAKRAKLYFEFHGTLYEVEYRPSSFIATETVSGVLNLYQIVPGTATGIEHESGLKVRLLQSRPLRYELSEEEKAEFWSKAFSGEMILKRGLNALSISLFSQAAEFDQAYGMIFPFRADQDGTPQQPPIVDLDVLNGNVTIAKWHNGSRVVAQWRVDGMQVVEPTGLTPGNHQVAIVDSADGYNEFLVTI